MSDETPTATRISVSEEKLRAILAEFKLELVEEFAKKASQRTVERLDDRVIQLELWKTARDAISAEKKDVSATRIALLGLAAALIGSLATLVWLHPHL